MTIRLNKPISIASVYLWIGFICAISFMEAWLKFKAPGVDMATGLGIGRLVFSALNLVEWFFTISIFISLFLSKSNFIVLENLPFYLAVFVLLIQTVWVLPALDARAQQYINGKEVTHSYYHFYYVVMEILKVGSLFIFSIKLFREQLT